MTFKWPCIIGFHCWHTDYSKPFTWEDVEKSKHHGKYEPTDIRSYPSPPAPSRPIPAGYVSVCCNCNAKKNEFNL